MEITRLRRQRLSVCRQPPISQPSHAYARALLLYKIKRAIATLLRHKPHFSMIFTLGKSFLANLPLVFSHSRITGAT